MRRRSALRQPRDGSAPARFAAAAAIFLLSVAPAAAQDLSRFAPGPGDSADAPSSGYDALYDGAISRPLLDACLAAKLDEGRDRSQCLGLTMDACLKFEVNSTTLGSIRCAQGEMDAWIGMMNDALAELQAKGDDGLRRAVETSQTAWAAHRLATCRIWGEIFRGGSLARQIGADCMRESAGRRALDLIAVREALDP